MKPTSYPRSRSKNIVIQKLNKEILLYDLHINKAYCLNQTSAMIWQECDGTKAVTDISRIVSKKAGLNVSADIVWLALEQLKSDKLLENGGELTIPFNGQSRREIVKRIGFAAAIVLPVVSHVVAPSAINAQSGGAVICGPFVPGGQRAVTGGGSCNNPVDCCTNNCSNFVCTAGGLPGGAAACCVAVTCIPAGGSNVQPGCPCNNSSNCASNACVGVGICQV